MLANRIKTLSPSATLALNAKVLAMKKQGLKIFNFGLGEPDFDTPQNIKQAAKIAIEQGFTKYTPEAGIPELRLAICQKLKRENNLTYQPENIMTSNGAKQVLYNIFQVLVNPGDEVILPSPYWFTYQEQIKLAGGRPVFCLTGSDFKLKAKAVADKISPQTKILILNSPSNPSGAIIEKQELEKIAQLAIKHHFYVISDEVYEHFVYDGKRNFSLACLGEEIKNLTLTVNAVSKTYAMTGWRIGWAAGPQEVIKAMNNLQSHSTSCACSIAQKAALEALTGEQESVAKMIKEYDKRRLYVYKHFNQMPGFNCQKPAGAFYAFIEASKIIPGRFKGSVDFANFLLEKAHVAIVPGIVFGQEWDNFFRFSFAASLEEIKVGIQKIKSVRK